MEREIPKFNATREEIAQILKKYKSIAVVGISDRPDRPSYYVTDYMYSQGYAITPVNPAITSWQGMQVYPDLKSAPGKIEIVNIFRKPADVPPVVDAAIEAGAKVVWMQSGIVNNAAAEKACAAGLQVVMDHCIMVEHRSL